MKECDFLLSIDNKEILIEILNHSIDFLIGNQDEQQTMRMCHKYGFHNPDDFLLATRNIANLYRDLCCSDLGGLADSRMDQSVLSPELQVIIPSVLRARRTEVLRFLVREHNAGESQLVESFDWDTRLILGDSSFDRNVKLLATFTFRLCRDTACKKENAQSLHFQINRNKLDEFITAIELSLNSCK